MNLLAISPRTRLLGITLAMVAMFAFIVACGDSDEDADTSSNTPAATQAPRLSGTIDIDGSSTVFPVAEAIAEEFGKEQPNVRVTVGIRGTGGGFQRFCAGETAMSNASRPISTTEIAACQAKGIEYIELPIAYDALSVVVHPSNNFLSCITVAELKTMWAPAAQGTVTKWNQVNPAWPDADLKLFGPGADSGTFDYFTEHVNGKAKDSRGDFTASEDDNVLVQGVSGDRNALGYFGLAYYIENQGKLKALEVNQDKGCVAPSAATVENGTYPLSRPLFVYVRKDAVSQPEVKAYVDFMLDNAAALSEDVGYVKFPDNIYTLVKARWTSGKVGTMYANLPSGTPLQQALSAP